MAEEVGIQKSPAARLREYVSEVRVEMKRVTWPSWDEVKGTTLMVILTTFLFGIYFWICDEAFSNVVARILKMFLRRA